jgi:hypothetical protein
LQTVATINPLQTTEPVATINPLQTTEQDNHNTSIRKVIKRKYVLGKNNKSNKIGILIKDKTMRNNVMQASRNLKKKSIQEVKEYLKDHGLYKYGGETPPDVLRKIYETSMMAGDIQNKNKDTMLHNFIHGSKEDTF